jgi:predicted Zn-dependent peptidase
MITHMSQFQTREERGISVHVLSTKKYKKNTIVTTFMQDLQEETATPLALLPYVLTRGSQAYPTPERLSLALDDLYGAYLGGTIDKKGERHIVDFTMTVSNEKFLSTNDNLFQQALDIMADVILRPLTVEGGFKPEHVDAEIEQHKKRIAQVIDDKIALAGMRCLSEMTKGEPYSIPRLGYEERLGEVTPQGLYEVYQQLLRTAPMHVYVVGDVEFEAVCEQIFRTFDFEREPDDSFREVKTMHEAHEVKEVVDHYEVSQGKLNIGMWANVDYASDDYPALLVYNGIFGLYPHSKLFLNVREKNSLAYYCSSRVDALKGLLYVQSGVEFKNFDKALSIIKEQLDVMRQGQITDEEMEFTVRGIINDLKTGADSATGQADYHLNGLVGGRIRTREEMIESISKVTADDVVRIAKGVQMDTVYKLMSKEGADHA